MSATPAATATTTAAIDHKLHFRAGRWIDNWNPEDTVQWEAEGSKIAKRNLGFSVYAEFLGFCVWQLWSIVVTYLNGWQGFKFDSNQQFWLISLPSLVGATLRFPYTFMISKIGGRNWTICSATLLLIPTIAMGFAISNHPTCTGDVCTGGTSYGVMLLVAALGGFGGGNFASSMANITFFFPQRTKGWALGLNAAGGNIGASISQFIVPIVISIGAAKVLLDDGTTKTMTHLPWAGWFWVPFIVAAMIFAAVKMNNLSSAKADMTGYKEALKDPHLWITSFLYIGTFGSFIGLAGAFPKLIKDQFPTYSTIDLGIVAIGLAFLGPLVGSLARPYGGRLADKIGGAYITVGAFIVMIAATFTAVMILKHCESVVTSTGTPWHTGFWIFLLDFLVLFIATGVGNGSMYKMIPNVFQFRAGVVNAQTESGGISVERKVSSALGIVSAFGAYGGFFIPQVFNQAIKLHKGATASVGGKDIDLQTVQGYQTGLWWLFAAYIVFLIVTIVCYVLPYSKKGTRV
ncbi:MAG: MFS transporter [Propionibacteriaceae bacterium]|jgi:NNP family nitrate/nitrite transporter-like MFS transporter|nr:MFS transporter [Propionibacteriaceae bacterium]